MYLEFCEEESNYGYRMYSAPTAEEILRRLPYYLDKSGVRYWFGISRTKEDEWWLVYRESLNSFVFEVFSGGSDYGMIDLKSEGLAQFLDASLANAAAAMYCYFALNNLLPLLHV